MNFPYLGPKAQNTKILLPQKITFEGEYCVLEPVDYEKHLQTLFESIKSEELWLWAPVNAPKSVQELKEYFQKRKQNNIIFYVMRKKSQDRAIGILALVDAKQDYRSIQIGYFRYSPDIQRTTITTQSFYLLARYVFQQLNFNRLQWQANKHNKKSRYSAQRFGFFYQGCFRQDYVFKGYYGDSVWYSILSHEWPKIKQQFDRWLAPTNFDTNGKQLTKLGLRQIRKELNSQ